MKNLKLLFLFILAFTALQGCKNPFAGPSGGTETSDTFRPGLPQGLYPHHLVLVSGDNQTAAVGGLVTTSVQVVDITGAPVPNYELSLSILSGGGSVANTIVTNATGTAAISWTLGSTPGAQSLKVAGGSDFSGTPSSLTIQATAILGGVSLTQSYVTLSSTTVASASSITATLHTRDASNNPLTTGGLAVAFSRTGGTSSGTFSAVTDNNDGTYSATFTGTTAGTATSIAASIGGFAITSALPTLTVTASAGTSISISSGNNQSAVVANPLGANLIVLVQDISSNPVNNVIIDWSVSGNAALFSSSSTTNSSGLSANTLSVGTITGTYTVTATVHGTATSVSFTEAATPGIINNFLLSSVPALATAGNGFSFTLTARDSYNNTKTDYNGVVHFTSSDSNSPTLPSDYTFVGGDLGVKSFSSTLKTSGNQTLTATQVAGGTPTVTSSNISVSANTATQLALITGPTNTVAGTSIATMLVRALDVYGNTATGFSGNIALSISTNPGGGTLSGTATVAAVAGSASFPGLSIDKTGVGYKLTAASSGLTSFASSLFNITPGTASSIAVVSGNNQTGTVAQALASALVAVVKDANNNAVPGVTVDWSSASGDLTSASVSTDSSGLSSNTFTLSNTAGVNSVTALIHGTAISTSFSETGTASTTIGSIVWQTSPSTTYTASSSTAMTTFTAKLLDSFGNLITSNNSTTMTLSLNQGTGALGGTLTQTAVNGIVTFNNITYTKAETIKFTATENTASHSVTSSLITVSPNSPSSAQSTIAAGAASVNADGATPVNITITLKDAYANPIPSLTAQLLQPERVTRSRKVVRKPIPAVRPWAR